jgi:hypothetical protein
VSDIYELQLECPEKWDDDDVPQLTKSYFRYWATLQTTSNNGLPLGNYPHRHNIAKQMIFSQQQIEVHCECRNPQKDRKIRSYWSSSGHLLLACYKRTISHCGPLRFIKSPCLANDIPIRAGLITLVVGRISFVGESHEISHMNYISPFRCLPYWLGISTQPSIGPSGSLYKTHGWLTAKRIAAPGPRRLAAMKWRVLMRRRTINHQNLLNLQTNLYVCHTSIHLCMQVRMYTYIYIHTYIYIYTYVHMHTYVIW